MRFGLIYLGIRLYSCSFSFDLKVWWALVFSGQSSVGSLQWAVFSGQLAVFSLQSSVGSLQSSVGSGQWAVFSDQHKVTSFEGEKKRRAKGVILWGVGSWQSSVGSWQSSVGSGQLAVFSLQWAA